LYYTTRLFLFIVSLILIINNVKANNSAFVENKGQWPKKVKFKANTSTGAIYLEENGITHHFFEYDGHVHPDGSGRELDEEPTFNEDAIYTTFKNINKHVSIEAKEANTNYYNYFLGNDPKKWATGAKSYANIWYRGIYDGINLNIYQTKEKDYKYDYTVSPGGDPLSIVNQYSNHQKIEVQDGHLIVSHELGQLIEMKPYAYQIINGVEKEITCNYIIKGDNVSFNFPNGYNHNVDLIIDPQLIFSTFSGATRNNFGMTATYDRAGNGYTGGVIYDAGYPFTGAFADSSYNGGTIDVAISKYSADGQSLIYTTYYGGSETEMIHSMVVNANNELLFFGATSSNNIPSVNAIDSSFNGGTRVNAIQTFGSGSDIYAARISADGTQFLASTYLGGSENDGLNLFSNANGANYSNGLLYGYGDQARGEINVDNSGNIYIISSTYSSDFPIVNSLYDTLQGNQDIVLIKLSPTMHSILWSTYIGGSDNDAGYAIKFNSKNELYIAGGTKSTNFPLGTGSSPFQGTFNGGSSDGFVLKLKDDGSEISAGTYLGTTNYDQAFFVEVDRFDGVYAFGHSSGGNFPVLNASYFNQGAGQFIIKLDDSLSTSIFSTTVGSRLGTGKIDLTPTAFLVDKCQNIYMAGWGNTLAGGAETQPLSAQMPITPNALKSTTHGYNFYFMVLSKDAEQLEFGSFFGGTNGTSDHVDGGTSRFDENGIIYQSVCADCRNNNNFQLSNPLFPVNVSPSCSNALFKISLEVLPTATIRSDADSICAPAVVNFETEVGKDEFFYWSYGNGIVDSINKNISINYTQPGFYPVQLIVGDSICGSSDTTIKNIYVFNDDIQVFPINDTAVCSDDSLTLSANYTGTVLDVVWSTNRNFTNRLNQKGIYTLTTKPDTTTTFYIKVVGLGCDHYDTVEVISDIVKPQFALSDSALCSPATFQFIDLSENYDSLNWDFGNGLNSNQFNPLITLNTPGKFEVRLTAFNLGCNTDSTYTDSIEVYQSIKIDNLKDTIVCNGGDVIITPNDKGTANSFLWSNNSNFSDTITTTETIFISNIQTTKAYYLRASNANCDTTISFVITTPSLTVELDNEYRKCEKDTVLVEAIVSSSSNFINYRWTPQNFIIGSDTSSSILISSDQNITYHLELFTNEGCRYKDSVVVVVSPPSVSQLFPTISQDTAPLGKYVLLESDVMEPFFNYFWEPSSLVETPNNSSTLTRAIYDTLYTLTIFDDSTGCTYNGSLRLAVYDNQCAEPFVFVPSAFTPNNDGNNDLLFVRGPNIQQLSFQVFNRWGEMVFETNDLNRGWDGRFRGENAPPAVYAYQLKAICYNGTTYTTKGDVTLIR
jgi:gliding motility-associated-like protein